MTRMPTAISVTTTALRLNGSESISQGNPGAAVTRNLNIETVPLAEPREGEVVNTTYGKGRDKGKTSAPTTAMKAVVRGVPFRMPYFGCENYHFVEDVAAHFASCALDPFGGFGAFNIRGETIAIEQFLEWIGEVAGQPVDLDIAADATPAIFACDLDDRAIQSAFPNVGRTPLKEGIAKTLDAFRQPRR